MEVKAISSGGGGGGGGVEINIQLQTYPENSAQKQRDKASRQQAESWKFSLYPEPQDWETGRWCGYNLCVRSPGS